MNKRPGFIVVVIVFIVAIVAFYIFLKKQQNPGLSPINAVPINSALVIDIKKPLKFYDQLLTRSGLFKKLSELNEVNNLKAIINGVDTIVNGNPKLSQLFGKNPLLISLHDIGKNEFCPLFVVPVSGRFESNKVFKEIELNWSGKFTITDERYNQVKFYKLLKDNKPCFFYSYHKGLLLGSNSEILLQDAIRQAESDTSMTNDQGLKRLIETAGDHSEANLYVQFQYFSQFFGNIFSEKFLKDQSIIQIGDWMELDLNLKNQTLLLNGFAFANQDENRFMNLFQGQSPQNIKFLKFVPTNAEGFWGFGLSDYNLYRQHLRTYMERMGDADRYEINRKHIFGAFGESVETDIESIFKNELIQVSLSDESSLFYVRTNGFRDASELLAKWLKHYCSNNNTDINQFSTSFSIDKESVFRIYKMPIDFLPTRLFGPYFKTCKANYVSVFDDYIIFSDSYNALSKTIYDNVLQKTLAYDGPFTQFADFLSSKVNFFGYLSLSGKGKVLEKRLSNKASDYCKKNEAVFNDFYAVAWQFASENNLYYNNFLFRHQPSNTFKAATEWETRLDTVIAFKPELMINHYTKEKEIFVQDEKNNVYLINHSGRILWKKNIEGPIMGEVFQVDYYKNGKFQYLFNTETKLHLLDRNGNFVERYPINLDEAAAASLAVFDYENNKNYRLFIPLKNKKIQVYNIEGKIVPGFQFQGTDNKIINPVQYFRDSNKDYIVVTDESRVYILDRRGNNRVNSEVQFSPSLKNTFEYQSGNNTRPGRLVRTDVKGTIYYLYFDGTVEQKQIQECSPDHYFGIEDVTGDHVNDYVFVDGKKYTVYNLAGDKVYEYEFATPIRHKPSFYRFSANKTYVGITEADLRKIYLFDNKGEFFEGFPLPGQTRFSIGFLEPGSGRFNLVVGGNEYYLYNYKLN